MTKFSVTELEQTTAGGSRTDLARLRIMTEAELEAKIANDPDWQDVPSDWHLQAEKAVAHGSKKLVSLRIDADVLDWFKQQGAGYQTRINAVLRVFVEHGSKPRSG
jgi:uncharacterized protein (DUF4415 family)